MKFTLKNFLLILKSILPNSDELEITLLLLCVMLKFFANLILKGEFFMTTEKGQEQHSKLFTVNEWKAKKRWNPYNSYKLLAHVERWKNIRRGRPIPAPVLITVDPSNVCDLNCEWCNARYIRERRNRFLSEKTLVSLADFLPRWGGGQICQ